MQKRVFSVSGVIWLLFLDWIWYKVNDKDVAVSYREFDVRPRSITEMLYF